MPKVIVEAKTFFKKQVLGSSDLAKSEKISVSPGQKLDVIDCVPARNQHVRLILATPLVAMDGKTQIKEVYAYAPHIELEGDNRQQLIKLNVPYFSQVDNDPSVFGPGWRQCNTTSNAMLADYLLKGDLTQQARVQGYPEPESVYMRLVSRYGDTTDHSAQTKALVDLGIESYFTYTLSPEDVLRALRANIPVVCGFAYKGSGHICVIVGHDPDRQTWLIHDPYGTRHGSSDSYDIGVGGNYDPYSYDTMQLIFWDQGSEAGWGRVVTAVKGQATGLPRGL
jgi:Peptidase_C39 like family